MESCSSRSRAGVLLETPSRRSLREPRSTRSPAAWYEASAFFPPVAEQRFHGNTIGRSARSSSPPRGVGNWRDLARLLTLRRPCTGGILRTREGRVKHIF